MINIRIFITFIFALILVQSAIAIEINPFEQTAKPTRLNDFEITNIQVDAFKQLFGQAQDYINADSQIYLTEEGLDDDSRYAIHFKQGKFETTLALKHIKSGLELHNIYVTSIRYTNKLKIGSIYLKARTNNDIDIRLDVMLDAPTEKLKGEMDLVIEGSSFSYLIELSNDWKLKAAYKMPKRKPYENHEDSIPIDDKLFQKQSLEYPKESKILKLESKSISKLANTINGWTVKYPLDKTKTADYTYGPSILFIVHPSIAKILPEYKFRAKYPIILLDKIADIFEKERIIDGTTNRDMRYHTAHEPVYRGDRYAYSLPPNDVCRDNVCTQNYESLLEKMVQSQELRKMRIEWNADVVLFVHAFWDPYAQISGKAYKPVHKGDRGNKNHAFAVAGWGNNLYSPDIYPPMHELFHVLGAGHSKYNPKPGNLRSKAFIGSYKDANGDKNAIKSFMAYHDVCKQTTRESYCQQYDYFSSPTRYVDGYDGKKLRLGSSYDNNKQAIIDFIREVTNYNKYL